MTVHYFYIGLKNVSNLEIPGFDAQNRNLITSDSANYKAIKFLAVNRKLSCYCDNV